MSYNPQLYRTTNGITSNRENALAIEERHGMNEVGNEGG
jgi:hypothetical protein